MKNLKIFFGAIMLTLVITGIPANCYSQDKKQDKKSRKEAKKAEMQANFKMIDSLLYTGRYVLEANFLQGKYGDRFPVSSTINFIRVNAPRGVLQTGSDTREGYNGVGGVTAEGNIVDYLVKKDTKNLSHSVTFNLMTNLGTFDIFLTVTADNYANATITGTTSGRLSWSGRLVPLDNSRIFKGFDTY